MSTATPPEDTAADDGPNDPVPLPGRTAPDGRNAPRQKALIGADLVMVLIMASVIGLLLGVVGLVELLT